MQPTGIMRKPFALAICLGLVLLPLTSASADEALEKALQYRVDQVKQDPAALKAAMVKGREAAGFCVLCHGETGNSSKPEVPHLAGQNPVYLLDQLERFTDGRRDDFIMSPLAKKLTPDEKVALVVFYANQQRRTEFVPSVDPALLVRGREIFEKNCVSCHGDDGRGKEGYAYIAALPEKYIASTLTRFREPDSHRINALMAAAASNLSNDDIDALAAYLSNLR
jgi:cytochrome c553